MEESSSVATVLQALRHEARRLAPGGRLPSVRALMARHRVSPGTVRLAMARLADEGVLDARPGHGTFVWRRGAPQPPWRRPTSAGRAWRSAPSRISADDAHRAAGGAGRRRASTSPAAIRPRTCRPWTSCRAPWRGPRADPACGAACRSKASTGLREWFARAARPGGVTARGAHLARLAGGDHHRLPRAGRARQRRCWSSRRPTSARWWRRAPPACGWCRCRPIATACVPRCWPRRFATVGRRVCSTLQPRTPIPPARRSGPSGGVRCSTSSPTPERSSSRTTGVAICRSRRRRRGR